jgi:hypothetical protein
MAAMQMVLDFRSRAKQAREGQQGAAITTEKRRTDSPAYVAELPI